MDITKSLLADIDRKIAEIRRIADDLNAICRDTESLLAAQEALEKQKHEGPLRESGHDRALDDD